MDLSAETTETRRELAFEALEEDVDDSPCPAIEGRHSS
jgi:hypothetical protein